MKKIIAAVLVLTLMLALASCGGKKTETEENAGMVNPVQESSLEEIRTLDKLDITLSEAAENVRVTRINGSTVIDSIDLTIEGKEYNYRIAATDVPEDISGMNYEWGEPEGGDISPYTPRCLANGLGQGIMTWYRDGHSFSISMKNGATGDDLMMAYEMLNDSTVVG